MELEKLGKPKEQSEIGSQGVTQQEQDELTVFHCGVKEPQCNHDWSGPSVETKNAEGETESWTSTCKHCGVNAMDWVMWNQFE